MFLMYVDECGDCGMNNSPTTHFGLSGIVLHESMWKDCLEKLIVFRRRMKSQYGIKMREELHARQLLMHPGKHSNIMKHDRLAIIRAFTEELSRIEYLNVINVIVNKSGKQETYDPFQYSWTALLERFENGINNTNFNGPVNKDNKGMIFPDNTDRVKLRNLLRRLRRINYIPGRSGLPSRNLPFKSVIEDPNMRDSEESYLIQAADLVAFLLYQHVHPCKYFVKKGCAHYINRLQPVLYTHASSTDNLGIVSL